MLFGIKNSSLSFLIDNRCIAGSLAPSTLLLDSSQAVIRDLFAPFPAEGFPLQAERTTLMELLQSPFTTTVPVSPLQHQLLGGFCPDLFRVDDTRAATRLECRLSAALLTDCIPDSPTKHDLMSSWDNVGFELPAWVGKRLGLDLKMRRYSQLSPATYLGWQIWGSCFQPGFG